MESGVGDEPEYTVPQAPFHLLDLKAMSSFRDTKSEGEKLVKKRNQFFSAKVRATNTLKLQFMYYDRDFIILSQMPM